MKNKSIKQLRIMVIIFAVFVFLFGILALPKLATMYSEEFPNLASIRHAVFGFLLFTSIPFFIAIAQAIKVCNSIISDEPFSRANIKAFIIAKYCALSEIGLYLAGGLAFYYYTFVLRDILMPVAFIIDTIVTFCAVIMTICCSVLVELLTRAIELREENEMTI